MKPPPGLVVAAEEDEDRQRQDQRHQDAGGGGEDQRVHRGAFRPARSAAIAATPAITITEISPMRVEAAEVDQDHVDDVVAVAPSGTLFASK